jgi:repressor LexA
MDLGCCAGGTMALTKRQYEVLSYLDSFIRDNGYCPSFKEIGKSLNLSSLATVHKHIQTLETKGFIRRGYNQSRSIEVVSRPAVSSRDQEALGGSSVFDAAPMNWSAELALPMFGRIAAGRPLEAVTNSDSLSLKDFIGNKDVYVLKVKGDSMVDDHICDDDYVIVERTETADDGDTIVALVDGNEATLKRFYREKDDTVRLQPANPSLDPILIKLDRLKIQGRVIGVLRKY